MYKGSVHNFTFSFIIHLENAAAGGEGVADAAFH